MSENVIDKGTSIRISHANARQLAEYGRKAESYDDILTRILAVVPKKHMKRA